MICVAENDSWVSCLYLPSAANIGICHVCTVCVYTLVRAQGMCGMCVGGVVYMYENVSGLCVWCGICGVWGSVCVYVVCVCGMCVVGGLLWRMGSM